MLRAGYCNHLQHVTHLLGREEDCVHLAYILLKAKLKQETILSHALVRFVSLQGSIVHCANIHIDKL